MKPRLPLLLAGLAAQGPLSWACELCEAPQPKILRGLTHGVGPQGNFDYIIVVAMIVVVVFTLFYAIKFLVRPGEREASHIKRIVLDQNHHGI